jgi:uncharacterized damage-inducible protein DinB
MDAKDLVLYNHRVRKLFFEALAKLPWSEVVKLRGASFDSMRNIFLHLTIVEDRWINYVLPGRFKEWVDPAFDDFGNLASLGEYMVRVEKSTQDYLNRATPEKLAKEVTIPWGDTPDTMISIETALCHMVTEDLLHLGELSDILWRMEAEAPYLAFWRFKHDMKPQEKTVK